MPPAAGIACKNTDLAVLDAPSRAGVLSRNPHRMDAFLQKTVRWAKDSPDLSQSRLTTDNQNAIRISKSFKRIVAHRLAQRIRRPTRPAQQRLDLVRPCQAGFLGQHPARLAFGAREQAINERPGRCPLLGPDKDRGNLRFQSFKRRPPIRNRYSPIRYRHTRPRVSDRARLNQTPQANETVALGKQGSQ